MPDFSDLVPIPPTSGFNIGLTACRQQTMLDKLGVPGPLSKACSDPVGPVVARIRWSVDVGPFKVSGLDFAVESLAQLFDEVRGDDPALYAAVKTDGMICVRHRSHNPAVFSNHSWGTAIDLFFGADTVPQGELLTERGVLKLVPYFNKHGWYWGGGFSGDSVDSMHFELADETVRRMSDRPLTPQASAPATTAPMQLLALSGDATASSDASAAAPSTGPLFTDLGTVCDEWDYDNHVCANRIPVSTITGRSVCLFETKLAIDADGAPRAYHPKDEGSYDVLGNLSPSDNHGVQGKDAVGPAPGFVVSGTTLQDSHFPSNDTRRYVDAATIPYVVLPTSTPMPSGIALHTGCVALVIDTASGISTGAIYADVGRAVGEGSIALALRLGLRPFKKRSTRVTGFDEKRFLYIVFPAVTVAAPWPVSEIQKKAMEAFEANIGEAELHRRYPDLPPLSGPSSGTLPS